MKLTNPRVFLSHSSRDKQFVKTLALDLARHNIDVWYDEWEIAVGDSIIDKVLSAVKESDTLVVVMSPASVESRWVKEELNTAVMQNIRILPVQVTDCEIPASIRHLRYADFRFAPDYAHSLSGLLSAILPTIRLWESLAAMHTQVGELCDKISGSAPADNVTPNLVQIQPLLEAAVSMRVEIEFRRHRVMKADMDLYAQINALAEVGIDVRSKTWGILVVTHYHMLRPDYPYTACELGEDLRRQRFGYDLEPLSAVGAAMERMKELMKLICTE